MKIRKRLADIPHTEPVSLAEIPHALQEDLLTLLIYDTESALKIRSRVSALSFEGIYSDIARSVYPYLDKHRKAPGAHLDTLLGGKLDKSSKAKRLHRALKIIKRIYNAPTFNAEYVMGELDNFVDHQRLKTFTQELLGVFNRQAQIDKSLIAELRGIAQGMVDDTSRSYGGQSAASIVPRDPVFLWHPYLVAGEINIIGGKGGIGKGVMLSNIAAKIVTGGQWPNGSGRAPKGHVLWGEAEDSLETTVVPRLIGNDVGVRALQNITLFNREDFLQLDLKGFVREKGVKLIVLSPLNSFLPKLKNSNDELTVRRALERLHDAVQDTDCAIAAIMHLNKKTDLDSVERLLGSSAFNNFSRSVLLINSDEEHEGWKRLIHAKWNMTEKSRDLLFEISNTDGGRNQYLSVNWHRVPDGQDVDADSFLDRRRARSNAQKLSDKDKRAIKVRWEAGEKANKISDGFPVTKRWINELAKQEGWMRGE